LAGTSLQAAKAPAIDTKYTADKIADLSIGDSITVRAGGQDYTGKINSINLTAEGHSLSQPSRYRVKVLLSDAANLMPGQAARIIVDKTED